MRVTSTLASTPALATDQTLTENRFSVARALNPTSTPPVTKEGAYETVIAGGVMDIDLTALATVQGAADCSGLKLQSLFVKNTGLNVLTIDAGPVNGYEINGVDSITVRAGGEFLVNYKGGQAAVGATSKIIRITGTTGDIPQVQLLLG
jgi:hypothetical protein